MGKFVVRFFLEYGMMNMLPVGGIDSSASYDILVIRLR